MRSRTRDRSLLTMVAISAVRKASKYSPVLVFLANCVLWVAAAAAALWVYQAIGYVFG